MNERKGNYNIFINESKFDIMKHLNIRLKKLCQNRRILSKFAKHLKKDDL